MTARLRRLRCVMPLLLVGAAGDGGRGGMAAGRAATMATLQVAQSTQSCMAGSRQLSTRECAVADCLCAGVVARVRASLISGH
jgi:hypothetical protein